MGGFPQIFGETSGIAVQTGVPSQGIAEPAPVAYMSGLATLGAIMRRIE